MNVFKVSAFCVLAGAMVACTGNDEGTLVTPDPVAGFRYVNLVADTGAMDFRIIDVVANAPNQTSATFRTGGNPSGTTPNGFLPPYQAVLADGTPRHIRVFMSGSTPAIASTVMFDTTFTFTPNTNYTMYLYGYARTGQGGVKGLITTDALPTLAAGQFGVRVVHLAPAVTPTLAATNVDVFVDTLGAAVTPVGAATFANVAFGEVRPYLTRTARVAVATPAPGVPALNYRAAYTATGTLTPFVQADVPNGSTGTATVNPIAGDLVAGSVFSIVIVPPSVTGSTATNFATPSALFLVDGQPPRTAP